MSQLDRAHTINLFASPLLMDRWSDGPALNPLLRDSLLAFSRANPSVMNSNAGGWQSSGGMLEMCGAAGQKLVAHMREMVDEAAARLYRSYMRPSQSFEWVIDIWANVNQKGDFNRSHTHPGATWSGVYYVDDGGVAPGGDPSVLHISDPCSPRAHAFFPELSGADVCFKPEPGLMIVFPSYVPHSVVPHRGDRPRISIAFNAMRKAG